MNKKTRFELASPFILRLTAGEGERRASSMLISTPTGKLRGGRMVNERLGAKPWELSQLYKTKTIFLKVSYLNKYHFGISTETCVLYQIPNRTVYRLIFLAVDKINRPND